jgi:hypothetical protein
VKKSSDLTLVQHSKSRKSNQFLFLLIVFLLNAGVARSQLNWDWAKKAGSNQNWGTGMGVATDTSANVYATGFAQGLSYSLASFGNEDVFLAKYDPTGALLWATKCGGPGSDEGQGIAIDNSGYIYITGSFTGTATFKSANPSTVSQSVTGLGGLDIFIAKYDPSGVLQWVTKAGSQFLKDEEGISIAVDQSGGVYITGYLGAAQSDFYNQPGNVFASTLYLGSTFNTPAIFIAKYSNAGTFFWAKGVKGSGSNRGNGIAVNSGGTKVVVTGSFAGPLDFGNSVTLANSSCCWSNIFVAAYNAGGVAQWAQQGGGGLTDTGNAIAIDSADNIYVVGEFTDVATFYNDPATPGNGVSSPFTLTSHPSGGFPTADIVLAKYDSSGIKQWMVGPGGGGNDYGYGIALDGHDVAITGFFEFSASFGPASISSAGNFDVFVARYNSISGTVNSAVSAGGSDGDGGRAVVAGNFGVMYVTGSFKSNPASFGTNSITSVGGSQDVFVARLNANLVTGTDLYIQDASNDVGNEPDTQAAILWASPDIWVRNTQASQTSSNPPRYTNEHNHENPEYATIASNTPWIYVKTHNRGSLPVSGTLHVYWANASVGLNWQNPDWQEVPPTVANSITNLASGADWVVELQWTTIPDPVLSTGGHFCLLARFEADVSTPDPIVGEVFNNGIWGNVYNSNNIAWKNVTIINLVSNKLRPESTGQVLVHNIRNRPTLTKLSLDTSREDFGRFTTYGTISIDLGQKLFDRWKRGGMVGGGVRPLGGTWLGILAPHAWVGNMLLEPKEQNMVDVSFRLNRRPASVRHILNFDLVQYETRDRGDAKPVLIGGERFVVELGRKAPTVIKPPGRPSKIQTKPTTFDGERNRSREGTKSKPKARR